MNIKTGDCPKTRLGLFGSKSRDILEAMLILPDMNKMAEFGIRPDECATFDYNHQRPYWKIIAIGPNYYAPYMMVSPVTKSFIAIGEDFNGETVAYVFDSQRQGDTGYSTPKEETRVKKLIKIRFPKFAKDMRYFVEQTKNGISAEKLDTAPIRVYTHYREIALTLREIECFAAIVDNNFKAPASVIARYGRETVESIVGKPLNPIMVQRNLVMYGPIKDKLDAAIQAVFSTPGRGEEWYRYEVEKAVRRVYEEVMGKSRETEDEIAKESKFLQAYFWYRHYND